MYLNECLQCRHGGIKDGKSHCGREAVYSNLTNCIREKAIAYYLEQNGLRELPLNIVGNQ